MDRDGRNAMLEDQLKMAQGGGFIPADRVMPATKERSLEDTAQLAMREMASRYEQELERLMFINRDLHERLDAAQSALMQLTEYANTTAHFENAKAQGTLRRNP